MLTVSEAAAQAINALVTENGMPESSGLRIYRKGEEQDTKVAGLELSIAAQPADDDEVVEENGARVFLPPNVVNVLKNMQLNIQRFQDGDQESFDFTVDARPGTEIKRSPPGFPTEMPED